MENLEKLIEEFKSKCLLFGGKGRLAVIMETLHAENLLLKKAVAETGKSGITAEGVRDLLHTLEGEEMLDGDKIKNITRYLSSEHFAGDGKTKKLAFTIKKDILEEISQGKAANKFIKENI